MKEIKGMYEAPSFTEAGDFSELTQRPGNGTCADSTWGYYRD
ncbi:hypothetical protein GCM10022419_055320 [Nonomuraea rosea]|uniref:Lasso RiPP family leader peptide-containing protein n=1 Tax=Nonomuraea rosea TaxID=638574 RepID=A0ABP6XNG5_9ACTN